MSVASVQQAPIEARRRLWYTTGDAARALQVTDEGVRYLVRERALGCVLTPSGQRLFAETEVLELATKRNRARLRSVTALRRKRLGVRGGPRQLSFLAPRLQVVARGPVTLERSSRSRGIAEEMSRVR